MGDGNVLLSFINAFIQQAQGGMGKAIFTAAIIISGLLMWGGFMNKKVGFGIIGGAVFVFGTTFIAQMFGVGG